ncbi:IS4 family transposase [Dactylosporangium roseum]|uniref:IS4 family transposase n=1 Tax=Dactylosporangium roseum TaxID=47989 RepID=A0ABY5YZB0_9ACTN|nr:IS4 family transposase [Dactylosporangium roseum]UWZ33441.1 IS4 family transposase [Dactylosporangium roseum]UWZ33567.1 IS4 family transposase [Dactylosporangium roseum]UWZ33651.1 IS4 family transposase [Dactylosporangium roseum]UWZ33814.1 IS4 family transposase [Dactylosporangium roseum]UWZ35091.1 IS4 family transposase [Dactylosporangium roseum]
MSEESVIAGVGSVPVGVFAAGHLGELTRAVPVELVDAVLAETGRVQRRVRRLPSRVVVYWLLGLGLFGSLSYRRVWGALVGGLGVVAGLGVCPSSSGLAQARRRVGVPPLRRLFQTLAGPVAGRDTVGAWWRGLRTVAIDGSTVNVPDSPANRAVYGKRMARAGEPGYPLVRVVALVETGTRAVFGAVFGTGVGGESGETSYAVGLLGLLRPGMLLLADRGYDTNMFMTKVTAAGAGLLLRVKSSRKLPVLDRLGDGSYASVVAGVRVRVVEAVVTLSCADGSTRTGVWRLVTTLTDERRYPAGALIELYHERWEVESTFLAIKHTLLAGRVLRSTTPDGVDQELYALLTVYQALRQTMTWATDTTGADPDRASFTIAVQTARDLTIRAVGVITIAVDLVGAIGRAVLADLLPARRARISPRVVKRPISRYAYKNLKTPKIIHRITDIAIAIGTSTSPLTTAPAA